MERRIEPIELKNSFGDLLLLNAMTIATNGEDGEPHAAAVYFVSDDQINLYFFSNAVSQHSLDIDYDPRAAVVVNGEDAGWQEIYGLQMRGVIKVVQSEIKSQGGWELYRRKFPFVTGLQKIILENQMYVFIPFWIRLIDNRRGFGFKQEWRRDPREGEDPNWMLITGQYEESGSNDD
jgi:uncharacterized protein YhbP (UPF0306 family)